MGMRLQLLRHAKSDWDDAARQDDLRPLAKRGRRDIALIAERASETGLFDSLDLVVCSPTVRTRETLTGVESALPNNAEVTFDHRIYGASKKALYEVINELPDSARHVLLVGHNPGFHNFAIDLVDAKHSDRKHRDEVIAKYPTAAVATFEIDSKWSEVGSGDGVLTSYLRPRDLR